MNARRIKFAAIAGLALAMALEGFSLLNGMEAGTTTGPEALAVTPLGEVWLGVGQQLWRTSLDGHLQQQVDLAHMPLPDRPANLLRHPDGHMVATVRDDPRLFVLDAATARVVRTITPQWPRDLQRKGNAAINLAFAPDGRFAVATGGGHAVVLFGADGAFLARTAPDTYRFTNGLWWRGDDLWTTDTNRFVLRRLDGRTLAVLQNVDLPAGDPARFLGPARAASAPGDAPVALIRFRNGMIDGRVVVVQPGQDELPLPHDGPFEPNDVDWIGDQLLASDGASLSVRRWGADGRALSAFGDASLKDRFQQIAATRAGLERRHGVGLASAVAVFAVALVLAWLAQQLERREAPAGAALDLSRLGTPRLPGRALAGRVWRLAWPALLLAVPALGMQSGWLRHAVVAALPQAPLVRLAIVAAYAVAIAFIGISMIRAINRKSRLVDFEPVFNAVALRRLMTTPAAQLPMEAGEHVLETFVLVRHATAAPRPVALRANALPRWAVCTNQGLRLFETGGATPRLDVEFALGDVAGVATQPSGKAPKPWTPAGLAQRGGRGGWLEITLKDGRKLAGVVTAATVRDRVARLLEAPGALPATTRARPASAAEPRSTGPSPVQAALASAVVPGLGQWWQRRPGTGLVMFVTWAVVVLAVTIPVAWAALGVHSEVPASRIAWVIATQLAYAAIAAWDAWQAGATGRHDLPA